MSWDIHYTPVTRGTAPSCMGALRDVLQESIPGLWWDETADHGFGGMDSEQGYSIRVHCTLENTGEPSGLLVVAQCDDSPHKNPAHPIWPVLLEISRCTGWQGVDTWTGEDLSLPEITPQKNSSWWPFSIWGRRRDP